MNWLEIAPTSSIPNGEYKITQIPDTDLEVAVFNIDNQFFAVENRCPHQNLPLADGPVTEHNITCPFHGAVFSLVTGEVKVQPESTCDNLKIFPVKVENNIIKVNLNINK